MLWGRAVPCMLGGTRSPTSDLPPLTGGLGSINAQQQFVPASPSLMAPPRRGRSCQALVVTCRNYDSLDSKMCCIALDA